VAETTYDFCPSPGNPRNSEGDTLLLKDGRILLVWSRFAGPEDDARADLYATRSADWGRTWSTPYLLVSSQEASRNVMSVSLCRERGSGDALLFYLRKNSAEDLQVWMRRSADEGNTWSAAVRVSTEDGYNVMNNARVVQLPSGRLVAPVAHSERSGGHQVATCYLSDDEGHTWRRSRGVVAFEDGSPCQEPGVVRLRDGRLLMYIRTAKGHIYRSHSSDRGETWEPPAPILDLPAPLAPATMTRLSEGALVCAYNHRPDGARAGWADRTPLALARTDDDGRTWTRLADLESSDAFCYGYASLRPYGHRVVLTYYVWPRSAPRPFQDTTLRVRVVGIDRFS